MIPKYLKVLINKYQTDYWVHSGSENQKLSHELAVKGESKSNIRTKKMMFQRELNDGYFNGKEFSGITFEGLNNVVLNYFKRFPEELNEEIIKKIKKDQISFWNAATEFLLLSLNQEYSSESNINAIKAKYKRSRNLAISVNIQKLELELQMMLKENKRDNTKTLIMGKKDKDQILEHITNTSDKQTELLTLKIDESRDQILQYLFTTFDIQKEQITKLLNWVDEQSESDDKNKLQKFLEIFNIQIPFGLGKVEVSKYLISALEKDSKNIKGKEEFIELCKEGLPEETYNEIFLKDL